MTLKIKTKEEIAALYIKDIHEYSELPNEWVAVESMARLLYQCPEIECQFYGNNPEDLEDGIFVPYRLLKDFYKEFEKITKEISEMAEDEKNRKGNVN